MKFIKLTVTCTSETSDEVAYVLHELGSLGEVFDDYNDIRAVLAEKRWDYADASLFDEKDGCYVSGFFTFESDIENVKKSIFALKDRDYADFTKLKIDTETVDSVEWENVWKKYYKPFSIGSITVVPEWIEYTPAIEGETTVRLNPGPAFGTGTHETTSMCIELMQKLPIAGSVVLDFGCGSGILGICATKLGAEKVLFADLDEQAISATKYNCKINDISDPDLLLSDVRSVSVPADIIVANITADVLIDVLPLIHDVLKKDGYVVISGIINEKSNIVKEAYSEMFSFIDSRTKNEWSAFVFKS